MNLANKYIDPTDIESVEQLEQVFEVAERCNYTAPALIRVTNAFRKGTLAYIRFDSSRMLWDSINPDALPEGYTRIKPADILEPDYYDGEWHKWGGSVMRPIFSQTKVEVEFRDGTKRVGYGDDWGWNHFNEDDDIIRFRVLNSTTQGHKRAPLLREIAQEAEVNPRFWRAFRYYCDKNTEWRIADTEERFWTEFRNHSAIERNLRTVRMFGEVGENVIQTARDVVRDVDEGYNLTAAEIELARALLDLRTGADDNG